MHRRHTAAAALAAIAVIAVPGAASAKRIRFGSDLTHAATRVEAHGADSVFWSIGVSGKYKHRVPAKGQIVAIKIKGTAIRHGPQPLTEFHFNVLHPSHGHLKVKLTSGPFNIPVGGDPNRVTTYHPVNLCARKKDFISFNDEGGFNPPKYPNGTPFQVFASVTGSSTGFFTGPSTNGDTFKGTKNDGEELLMQMVVGTGKDSPGCPS